MLTQPAQVAFDHSPGETRNRTGWTLGVAAAAFASTVLPLLLFLRRFPRLAPFAVDANDTFYYLTVARNSLHTTFYSFDGMYPTNGFHPVWQFMLYTAMRCNILKPDDPSVTLHRLFIGNVLLLGVGFALLGAFSTRTLRRPWLAFLAVCPGFLWFAVALGAPVYLANWSYLNGMETSVELLCLGLALLTFSTASRSSVRLPIAMFFFGLTVLCRLDDIFFLLPILFLLWQSRKDRPLLRTILPAAVPLAMIAAYLLYNRISVGVFMPTSGAAKAGLSILRNFAYIVFIVFPIGWHISPGSGVNWFSEAFMRVFQMAVPAIVCGIFLFRRRARRLDLIQALCLGVLLKSLYNFVYVALINQGSWYYGASIFIANLVIALWLDRALETIRPLNKMNAGLNPWVAAVAAAVLVSVSFNVYVNHLTETANPQGQGALHVFDQRETLRAMVHQAGSDRFIEMDDGELSYVTDMPALSGLGLVLDPEASRAMAHGHFFDLALQRHDSLILACGVYRTILDQEVESNRHGQKHAIFQISAGEFDRYDLVPVAFDSASDVELFRITPKH